MHNIEKFPSVASLIQCTALTPEECEKKGFWELLTWIDDYVTSRPLSQMIPALRLIIDKQWDGDPGNV